MDKIVKEPALKYGSSYTCADYLELSFDEAVEIIRGRLVKMSPAPKRVHQDLSGNLFYEIKSFLTGKKCNFYTALFDLVLPVPGKTK
jgi:hypothetical protein